MTGTAEGTSHLTISRLNSVYLVAHDHPAPDRLRSQLDQTMRTRLAGACARSLSSVLDPADPAVWLIRRVELDLALDAGGLDEETLARAWSRGITMAVVRAIEFGPDGHSVLYFPDRAAYLAYFLGELIDGRAWGRWYLSGFESLRSLPAGTAAAEALAREPQWAEPALKHLAAQGRLERLLDLLRSRDAALVLDACVPPAPLAAADDPDRQVIDAVLTRWSELARRADWPQAVRTLFVVLETRRLFPELAPAAVRLAAERLSGLASLAGQTGLAAAALASLAVADPDAALAAVRQAGATVGLENLAFFVRLAQGDAAWLAGAVGAARAGMPQPLSTPRRPPAHEIIATQVAGLFVLVPFLRDLAWPAVLAAAPGGLDAARALCYLLCLKVCGRPRSQAARFDPALLAAVGLDHAPDADDLDRCTQADAAGHRGLGVLLGALAQSGLADLRCLHVGIVAQGGVRSLLLRETARGDWLYAAPLVHSPQTVLEEGLALIAAAGHAPDALLLDAASAAEFDTAALRLRGLSLLDPADLPAGHSSLAATADLAAYLARSRPSEPEVTYFSLSGLRPTVISQEADDWTWSVVARAAFRAFARQLLGFRDSSTPFVWENFLGGVGQVQMGSGVIDVRLPPSPLRMMLRLAGLASLTYTVPWLEDIEIHVSLPEE